MSLSRSSPVAVTSSGDQGHNDGMTFQPWLGKLPGEPSGVGHRILFRTTYRAMRDGKLWCESTDPEEVVEHAAEGDAFEVLNYYAVTEGWQPWTPPRGPS
jgi:hypothetical protein